MTKMIEYELELFKIHLKAARAYLIGKSKEDDDAPSQYARFVSNAAKKLEELNYDSNWKPISDPPKRHGEYFVFTEDEHIMNLQYNPDLVKDEQWGWDDRTYDKEGCVIDYDWIVCSEKVLYWMHIPKPPKVGDGSG